VDEAANRMHYGLDQLVADHPSTAGSIVLFLSITYITAAVVAFLYR